MKIVSGVVYTHKTNTKDLTSEQVSLVKLAAQKLDPSSLEKIEVLKIDKKQKRVSFIESSDWNTASEPAVGTAYMVDLVKDQVKTIKPRGQIYHHKWMFVGDDYMGFDINESKKWSEKWMSVIPKELKTRIGYKKFWLETLKKYNLI